MSDLLKHQFYILVITFFLSSCGENIENGKNLSHDAANSSILYKTDQYVGAHTCAECHEESHQKWMDSHHYHAMELPNEDIFMIRLDKVITMTESNDQKLIKMYNHYINDEKSEYDVNGLMKPNSEMGYISSVTDARKKLEKVFKLNQET